MTSDNDKGVCIIMNMKKHFELGMMHLLESKSIDSITVGELIEEVESSKGSFYKYYLDKYSLCCAALQSYVYNQISVDVDWETFIAQCLTAFQNNAKVMNHAFDSKDINSARNHYENYLSQKLMCEFSKNGGNAALEINCLTIKLYSYAVTELISRWLASGCEDDKEEVFRLICAAAPQLVFGQLRARTA